ncbi:KilA-N domain-containing protein [Brumimicrobium aurantiacum]|uniref:KilA-N domain-containing protein n=1 Tax=Brumimicrobium aurantiacum TaxID=1737063 RepID=A0A3E1F073_9FLAO|nr:KilA-N domain-containing protein [Brumimicrobium aurantiacum]RFC55222.1 KilA-N domain-containing protein [Brumimicrobium aurantiacum]
MTGKKKQIEVEQKIIAITSHNDDDYICLTDMVRGEEGNDHIRNWMRNRNTVEYLGIWEQLNNPSFKGVEFDTFKKEAGLNSFNLTPKKWVDNTDAIGIISKSGRYGGTYAHKDIAFEFGAWISPMFKLLLIKEFQRLKKIESNQYNLEWDVKRVLSKVNYQIHTDAVKNHIIPKSTQKFDNLWIEYAEEADLLNVALFGCTAKQWKEANPSLSLNGQNMRDFASINELAVLSNLESINSELIRNEISKENRFENLKRIAIHQLRIIDKLDIIKSIKKQSDSTFLDAQNKFNK